MSTRSNQIDRRTFLRTWGAFAGLGAFGLTGCDRKAARAAAQPGPPPLPFYDAVGPIVPIRAHEDRIFRITVCSRPFRAAGPRIEAERVGGKVIVHNYGHGGSGWSLSWGSGAVAVAKAMEAAQGDREIAVVGAGALGLTAAILLQRAGAKVTIYAKELSPYTRSSRATGSWTPDSRVALKSAVSPGFAAEWETMARTSFAMYQSYLGLPGSPIEWTDRYNLRDALRDEGPSRPDGDTHGVLHLMDRIANITPASQPLPPGSHPFPTQHAWRAPVMTFNVADYARQLLNDFYVAGGKFEYRDFHSPQEMAALPHKVIVNCTGYAAKALFGDESIVPVRGQIAWLIPQEGVHYGLGYKGLNVLARRDGIVLQLAGVGEDEGWGLADETPDLAEAQRAIGLLQELYARMEPARRVG